MIATSEHLATHRQNRQQGPKNLHSSPKIDDVLLNVLELCEFFRRRIVRYSVKSGFSRQISDDRQGLRYANVAIDEVGKIRELETQVILFCEPAALTRILRMTWKKNSVICLLRS